MRKKSIIVYFGAVVLCISMITASAGIINVQTNDQENKVKMVFFPVVTESDSMEATAILQMQIITVDVTDDTQVTTDFEDECQPTIGVDPANQHLLAYTVEQDFTENDIIWTYSIDGGQTWDPGIYYNILGTESFPTISYTGTGNRFTGTLQGDPYEGNGAHQYRFLCTDPTDYNTYELTYWDWSASYPYADRLIPDIGGYNIPGIDWWYGVIACVGTRDVRIDMPIFNYADYVDSSNGWSSYMAQYQGCKNVALDVDLSNGYFYAVFDYLDGTDWDLLLVTGGCIDSNGDERLDFYTNSLIGGSENTRYPAVGAYNDYVIILAQTDEAGTEDIVCYYSSDAGQTFSKSFVTTDGANDELYPTIVSYGPVATCTFTMNGDIYYSKTTDGGETWSPPTKINDVDGTVESAFRYQDITSDGTVVWTDNQNGNMDIYLDNVGAPLAPGIAVINGPVKGKPGKELEYKFSSVHPDGTDIIEFIVNWGDGNTETVTGPFASGEEATASHVWATKGDYIISAQAKDILGVTGPQGTLSISIPRARTINNFYGRLINYFPILKYLLGL